MTLTYFAFYSVIIAVCLDGQRVLHMCGMRKEWPSLETHCSLENVAERTSSKVCCVSTVLCVG